MTADDPKPPATEIREAPRELVAFVCAVRPDWDEGDAMTAVQACRTTQLEWGRIARGLVNLALKDENPPTRPGELWDGLRGVRSLPGTGRPPGASGEGGSEYLAAKAAKGWTGPQPALTEERERELLREAHDP